MVALKRKTALLPIGLDIGQNGIRLVQLNDHAGGLQAYRAAVWQNPEISDEALSSEIISDRIRQFLQQMDFSGYQVITGLCTPGIELHPIDLQLPVGRTADDQLVKAASWEIQRLTTLNKELLETNIWRLPAAKRAKWSLMGVAAPRPLIEQQLDICEQAGLECIKVDVSACALAGLIHRLRGQPHSEIWGLLDLGLTHTRLILCLEDSPLLVRSFEIGGAKWTSGIASVLKVGQSTADRYKREVGVTVKGLSERSPRALAPAITTAGTELLQGNEELAAMMMGILRNDLHQLAVETERSYEYLMQCYAQRTAGDLVLVGGGALLRGLSEFFSSQLGICVYPVSQCSSYDTEKLVETLGPNQRLELCALAAGLSWQGSESHAQC
ncbi:MAG: hypothetical protein HJJLKODD_00504 [Phycisphaerae bacterium]|nr:hypothetical protein [Phycisphaerae bacterium]